jgi:hypothetical protein
MKHMNKTMNINENEQNEFCFFTVSLGFRDSGITCIRFLIDKTVLEIIVFLCFFDKQCFRKMRKLLFLVQSAVEKSEVVCAWPALSKQSQF